MLLIALKFDTGVNSMQEMQKRLYCTFKCNKRNIMNLFGSNDLELLYISCTTSFRGLYSRGRRRSIDVF